MGTRLGVMVSLDEYRQSRLPYAAIIDQGLAVHETDTEKALTLYQAALKKQPGDATCLFNIGVAYEDIGEYGAAQRSYEECIKASPDYKEAYYNLALIHKRLAEEYQKAYRELDPI